MATERPSGDRISLTALLQRAQSDTATWQRTSEEALRIHTADVEWRKRQDQELVAHTNTLNATADPSVRASGAIALAARMQEDSIEHEALSREAWQAFYAKHAPLNTIYDFRTAADREYNAKVPYDVKEWHRGFDAGFTLTSILREALAFVDPRAQGSFKGTANLPSLEEKQYFDLDKITPTSADSGDRLLVIGALQGTKDVHKLRKSAIYDAYNQVYAQLGFAAREKLRLWRQERESRFAMETVDGESAREIADYIQQFERTLADLAAREKSEIERISSDPEFKATLPDYINDIQYAFREMSEVLRMIAPFIVADKLSKNATYQPLKKD